MTASRRGIHTRLQVKVQAAQRAKIEAMERRLAEKDTELAALHSALAPSSPSLGPAPAPAALALSAAAPTVVETEEPLLAVDLGEALRSIAALQVSRRARTLPCASPRASRGRRQRSGVASCGVPRRLPSISPSVFCGTVRRAAAPPHGFGLAGRPRRTTCGSPRSKTKRAACKVAPRSDSPLSPSALPCRAPSVEVRVCLFACRSRSIGA
jgi:hypothetical protein